MNNSHIHVLTYKYHILPVCVLSSAGVPGGFVGAPRAYQDQFRGFEFHRVYARRDFF